jgi:hypothetical protein
MKVDTGLTYFMELSCCLLPWTTSSAAAVESCHIHSSSSLAGQ